MASLPGAQTNVPKTFGALESPQDLQARYRHVAEVELHRYVSEAIIPPEQMRNINLTEYWKVSLVLYYYCHRAQRSTRQARQYTYPLLYQIAMDVLPAQASSVSSERVFSSSKRTCTSERNRLSSTNMEFLQVLKHAYYRRRRENEELETLDFVSHLYENLSLSDD